MAIRPGKDGNLWDDSTNPPTYVGPIASSPQSNVVAPNPMRVAAAQSEQARQAQRDAYAAEDQQFQRENQVRADRQFNLSNQPKLPVGYRMSADGSTAELIPGIAAPGGNASGKTGKSGAYNSVIQQIDRLYELYNDGIGQTKGIAGIVDYAPDRFSETNALFNTAGAALGDQGNAAFKVPGMGAQSDADAARFVAANQPQASDRDGAALEKLRALRQRLENNMSASGLDAPVWNYDLNGNRIEAESQDDNPLAAMSGNAPGGYKGYAGQIKDAQRAHMNDGGGAEVRTGNGGFEKYVTAQDRDYFKKINAKFNSGASVKELLDYNKAIGNIGISPADVTAAVAYRDGTGQYSRQGPRRGAGFAMPESGTRSLARQNLDNFANTDYGAGTISAANALSLGTLDEIAGITGGERAGQLAQYAKQYSRDQHPKSAFVGDVIGGVALGGPITGGLRLAGIKGAQAASPFISNAAKLLAESAPKAAMTAGTLQGGLTGYGEMNDSRLLGGALGSSAALAGSVLGNKAGQFFVQSPTATALGNKARGLIGRRQRPVLPSLDYADKMVNNRIGGDTTGVLTQLDNASNLGLPYTLADTDPSMRALADTAVTRSPNVRGMAEDVLGNRSRGQYDRLATAMERDLGPSANIPQYSEDLIKKAQQDSRPFYDKAMAATGASSVDVSGIAQTRMGQSGLRQAYDDVGNQLGPDNQPYSPTSLGFDLNDQGDVILNKTPSFETLDTLKKGFDNIINDGYDPMTKQYTSDARKALALKQNLVGQMDAVNPAYKEARAAYSGPARERDAFIRGNNLSNGAPDMMNYQLKGMSPSMQGQFRLGGRAKKYDDASSVRYSSNPFERIYGGPKSQEQFSILSDVPGGPQRFNQQYDLERNMALTNNKVLGNSSTMERMNNNADFDMGLLGTAAFDIGTTGTPMATASRLIGKLAKDEFGRIGGKKKAELVAPLLLNANPAENAALIREMGKKIKIQKRGKGIFGNNARARAARAGSAAGVGFTLPFTD